MTFADLCLFAAVGLYLVPIAVAKAVGHRDYDNAHPRAPAFVAGGWRSRALGAHHNGLEGFAFFASAILLAEFHGADQAIVDGLALGFVGTRVVYVAAYVGDRPCLRSLIWSLGLLLNIGIYFSPLIRA